MTETEYDISIAVETVTAVRAAAHGVTGGNSMFVDDDVKILAELANRAVEAGLTEGLHWTVLDNIDRSRGREPVPNRDRSAPREAVARVILDNRNA